MQNLTVIGIAFGLALALITAIGGFGWFIGALVLGIIGGVVGAQLEGRIDLRNLGNAVTGRGGKA